jgi:hypothetical protein
LKFISLVTSKSNPKAALNNFLKQLKRVLLPVKVLEKSIPIIDNGGTRSVKDRRQCSIMDHTPERRSGKERRSGFDRRNIQNFRGEMAIERRELFR